MRLLKIIWPLLFLLGFIPALGNIHASPADSGTLAPLSRPPGETPPQESETPDPVAFLSMTDIRDLRAKAGNTRLLLEAILTRMGWQDSFSQPGNEENSFALQKNTGSREAIALSPITLGGYLDPYRHFAAPSWLAGEIFERFGSDWSQSPHPQEAVEKDIRPLLKRINDEIKKIYQWTGYQLPIGVALRIVRHSDRFAYFTLDPDENSRTLTFDLELFRLCRQEQIPLELVDILIRHELIHSLYIDIGFSEPKPLKIASELLAVAVTLMDLQQLSDERREAVFNFMETVEAQNPSQAKGLSDCLRKLLPCDFKNSSSAWDMAKKMIPSPFFTEEDRGVFQTLPETQMGPLLSKIVEWAEKVFPTESKTTATIPLLSPAPVEPSADDLNPLSSDPKILEIPATPEKATPPKKRHTEAKEKRIKEKTTVKKLSREQIEAQQKKAQELQRQQEEEARQSREEERLRVEAQKELERQNEQAQREREARLAGKALTRPQWEKSQDEAESTRLRDLHYTEKRERDKAALRERQELDIPPFADYREFSERISRVANIRIPKAIEVLASSSFLSGQKQQMLSRRENTDLKYWIQAWSQVLDLLESRLSRAICDKRVALRSSVMGGHVFQIPNDDDRAKAKEEVRSFVQKTLAPLFQDYIRERWIQDLLPQKAPLASA